MNRAMSKSPSASRRASRNTKSSGHFVSAPGSSPFCSELFHSLIPSAQVRKESTFPDVEGSLNSIGSRSGGMLFSALALPLAIRLPRLSMARCRARSSSAASSKLTLMPKASTTTSGSFVAALALASTSFKLRVLPPDSRPDAIWSSDLSDVLFRPTASWGTAASGAT